MTRRMRRSRHLAEENREDASRLKELRERLQARRPTLGEAVESGEYDGPFTMGEHWETAGLIAQLRQARLDQGMTQEQLAAKADMDPTAISRIETGRHPNVTLNTLHRLAAALDRKLIMRLDPPMVPQAT